jgi:NADH-quinone oxidoreductase subunit J
MLDSIIFYFFAGVAVLSAALMVTRRNAIHSAVFLITTLLATAGIFLQLGAEFLFIAQIILYVGGIMVLFIFVIMLVRLDVALHQIRFRLQRTVGLVVAATLGVEVGVILYLARHLPAQGLLIQGTGASADKLTPNTEEFAKSLFSGYLLPFEIASVLLLVAMVGAVVMAKNKKGTEES